MKDRLVRTKRLQADIMGEKRKIKGSIKGKMEGEDGGNVCVSPRKFRMWSSRVEEESVRTER